MLLSTVADESFKEFVLDQLAALPELRVKAMFGGHGVYQADRFFGIIAAGRLYFKTDERSRSFYLDRDMEPFSYEKARRIISMTYFEVPADVLERRDELVAWAQRAIQAATSDATKLLAKSKPRRKPR